MMTSTTSSRPSSWEDLRKEARQLENQIDLKLVALSKMGTNFGSSSSSSDKVPLLNSPSEAFGSQSQELESLLARLSAVNEGMTDFAAKQPQSAAIHHTLQRHRDILQDYRQEFTKTRTNIESMMEREDLLSSVHRDIDEYRSGIGSSSGGPNKRMDLLLKESESARNSERMLDDQVRDSSPSRLVFFFKKNLISS